MAGKVGRSLGLTVPVESEFLPLIAAFVDQGSKGLGLDEESSGELALAAEEIVAYLLYIDTRGRDLVLNCTSGSHFIEVNISLPIRDLNLGVFNLTSSIDTDDETQLERMGLLIASRMTDHFQIARPAGGNLLLTFTKERRYPEFEADGSIKTAGQMPHFSLQEPDAARIKWFVHLVHHLYPESQYPVDFHYPGKIVDMAAAGDYRVLLAVGPGGDIGGGIVWKWDGTRVVEIFGPYIFHAGDWQDMARELLESCIGTVARSSALMLINRMPTPQLPEGYLEALQTSRGAGQNTSEELRLPVFRLLHEDMGSVIWAHPGLIPFLEREYRRLVFPREIQLVASDGEIRESFSVLSVATDRRLGRATLRPIWPGEDCAANLEAHLALMHREGMSSILFEMDLGVAWHADFTPGLLALGFVPRLILPYAGTADLVIFEWEGQA